VPGTRNSRYEFANLHQDSDGNFFLDVPAPVTRAAFPDDAQVMVGEGDTLHSIAWQAYKRMLQRGTLADVDVGPSRFFWVIGQINGIVDATAKLANGTILRVPSVQTLVGEILVPPPFSSRDVVT